MDNRHDEPIIGRSVSYPPDHFHIKRMKKILTQFLKTRLKNSSLESILQKKLSPKSLVGGLLRFRSAVPNLFLLADPQTEKRKLQYPLVSFDEVYKGFLSLFLIKNLSVKLKLVKIWPTLEIFLAYPTLGTADLDHTVN